MEHETAGDPVIGVKWTRRTTAKIAHQLALLKIHVRPRTVARLLKQMGYALRVNEKKISRCSPEQRDAQFAHITGLRERFAARDDPVVSVDTKKKELVGRFNNGGAAWSRQPVAVKDHDFRSEADGLAVPYGVYDLQANRGSVAVGKSHDTPEFAVDTIEHWWRLEGRRRYPQAKDLAILADCGGSNGYRCRAWKYLIQKNICDRHGLTVTVAHYPAGASKWNPIEHRLFAEISKNWAARPLDSFETVVNYISTTSTSTGLRVRAHLNLKTYQKGIKISDAEMKKLSITTSDVLPQCNYTLTPSENGN